MKMRGVRFLILAAGVLVLNTGCMSAAKQAFYELRGAKADVRINGELGPRALARYQSVTFAPATTTLKDKLCPAQMLRDFDRHADRLPALVEEGYPGGAPALRIESELQYYQAKGLLSGALLLTRVKLLSEGAAVADLLVVAESKSFREGGGEALAEASIKALAGWLQKQKEPPKDADE